MLLEKWCQYIYLLNTEFPQTFSLKNMPVPFIYILLFIYISILTLKTVIIECVIFSVFLLLLDIMSVFVTVILKNFFGSMIF